jgi:protein TonB
MQNEEILRASLDDIVFENRNKSYGAYFLRRRYSRHLIRAIIISSAIFILLISLPLIAKYFSDATKDDEALNLTPVEMAPPPLDPAEPPPPPPPIPPPPLAATLKFTPPVIKKDEDVKEDDMPPDSLLSKVKIDIKSQAGDSNMIDPGPPPGNNLGDGEPPFYVAAEIMPKFPGGDDAMVKFINDNLVYPPMAIENNIEGKVVLTFIVDKEGQVTEIEFLKKLGWGCDDAAVKVVKKMPAWSPGRQNGRNVAVKYNLPITFRLKQ